MEGRLIVTFHGTDINAVPGKYGRNIYRPLFASADRVTVGSSFIRGKCIAHGCPPEKITVLPMGIPLRPLPQKTNYGAYFLSVGRLTEVKGFRYSLEAFSLIAPEYPDTRYYIAGAGPLLDSLTRTIKTLNLVGRVSLLGEKTDRELASLYLNALAFIIPSIRAGDGSEEGQGLVVQEAESYGLPVIGAATGGIPDGVIQGVTGWLVPEKSPRDLAEKMTFFLKNPDARRRFGEAGKRFVLENYDNALLTARLVQEVYQP